MFPSLVFSLGLRSEAFDIGQAVIARLIKIADARLFNIARLLVKFPGA
jgi:hypothetical protein